MERKQIHKGSTENRGNVLFTSTKPENGVDKYQMTRSLRGHEQDDFSAHNTGNLAILEGGRVYQNSGQSVRIVGQGDLGIKGSRSSVSVTLSE